MALIDTTSPSWMLELSPKNIGNYTDDEILEVLCRLPSAISFIQNPKEEWQRFTVQYIATGIRYIKNPTVAIQRLAVSSNPHAIQYIKNLDEDLAIEFLMVNPDALYMITNPTPMMVSIAKIYS